DGAAELRLLPAVVVAAAVAAAVAGTAVRPGTAVAAAVVVTVVVAVVVRPVLQGDLACEDAAVGLRTSLDLDRVARAEVGERDRLSAAPEDRAAVHRDRPPGHHEPAGAQGLDRAAELR